MSVCVNEVRTTSSATRQLADMTVKELLALCAERGIEPPSKRKADIIAALEA